MPPSCACWLSKATVGAARSRGPDERPAAPGGTLTRRPRHPAEACLLRPVAEGFPAAHSNQSLHLTPMPPVCVSGFAGLSGATARVLGAGEFGRLGSLHPPKPGRSARRVWPAKARSKKARRAEQASKSQPKVGSTSTSPSQAEQSGCPTKRCTGRVKGRFCRRASRKVCRRYSVSATRR